jgi:citrate synthase
VFHILVSKTKMSVFIAFWFGRLLNAGKGLTLALRGDSYLNRLLEHEFQAEPEGTLTVTDNRTGSKYTIPIIHNAVPAVGFRQICVNRNGKTLEQQYEDGLRVVDPGYRNTAVKLSGITYM